MKLSDIVAEKAIVPELQAQSRDEAIHELIDAMVEAGSIPKNLRDSVAGSVLEREKRGSTGFGKGVAVPHGKNADLKTMAAAIGVSQRGVDFKALDREPVFAIVLLVSPEEQREQHLETMQHIFSKVQDDRFRRFLQQATSVEDVQELLAETDAK